MSAPPAAPTAASIRIATPADFADWPALLALLRRAFAYMAARIDPPSSLDALSAEDLRAKAMREVLFIATAHTATAPLLGCAFADVRADRVYIGKLAVDEAARGQGLARRLVDAAEALARARGRPLLELQTRVELVENQRCFAALGFRQVAATAHPGFSRPTSLTLQRSVPPAPH